MKQYNSLDSGLYSARPQYVIKDSRIPLMPIMEEYRQSLADKLYFDPRDVNAEKQANQNNWDYLTEDDSKKKAKGNGLLSAVVHVLTQAVKETVEKGK